MQYDEKDIREAFQRDYFECNGTLFGWMDEYFWWKNPDLKCAIQQSPTKSKPRCTVACMHCVKNSKGVVSV